MRTSDRILKLLYDRPEGAYGLDELAVAAGVDRPVLEAAFGELRTAGQRLETSPQRGVRLVRPVRLASVLIEEGLSARRVGRSVVCFGEVGSTNDVALEAIRQDDADGLVVLAERQTHGRGRQGRTWLSPPGRSILLSVLLVEDAAAGAVRHDALTIAAGLAVTEAIERVTDLRCGLKWPNDVLLDDAKVCGVLVELRREGGRLGVVLGVGINVNAAPPPEEVDRPATCLAAVLGYPVERVELVRCLLERLDEWVALLASGELSRLHDAFLARCRMINERVTVLSEGRCYAGRVLDVDPLRGLVLACDNGATVHLPAAGASVGFGGAVRE
ncbi:MAG TPA: biotin--[acetyl-CoA-carboxylase] ligase [Phycisphaerae bacterium]|nr:biotin--[acetyl-CoA-carboxylase] ligase [Phycisphaerae bacterium]